MDCESGLSAAKLTDDLIVEILCRLPFKSFCRFKCVCKAWLAFSSDPHYCKKLPKVPTGFFYQNHNNSAIQFINLSPKDEGIDGTLSFLPQYEHLKFVDCSNGLVLCEYRIDSTSADIFSFIVCNPATREWRALPDTQRDPDKFFYTTKLAFDPSWSPYFYVFNFQHDGFLDGFARGVSQVEMFSSCHWTWLVDDLWDPENDEIVVCSAGSHVFLGSFLHVDTLEHGSLVLEELETVRIGIPPSRWTIKSPLQKFDSIVDRFGCLGQSSGILHYAAPEKDGRTVLVWSYDACGPDRWTVKHRLSMRDAFGRDNFVHYDDVCWDWFCDYLISAVDLERELLFLFDYKAKKLLSYGISTGRLTEIQGGHHWYKYYVACYSKLPAPEPGIHDDEYMMQ